MEANFTIVSIISLLGAAQGLFLSILIFQRRSNQYANRFLALLVLLYSFYLTKPMLDALNNSSFSPHIVAVGLGIVLLFGPLHYLYVKFLISPGEKFAQRHWLHFLPYAVGKIYIFPYHFASADYKMNTPMSIDYPYVFVIIWTMVIQGLVYMILSLTLLKSHSERIKSHFSTIDKINLNWLRNITILTTAVWMIVLCIHIFNQFNFLPHISGDPLIVLAMTVLIYAMGYIGLMQPEIFSGDDSVTDQKKYLRSGLTEDAADSSLDKLLKFMETEKPFIDSNLKLLSLAKSISISPHHLSQIINDKLNQNFFDFVNSYRVEEAKIMLLDPSNQHFTLLAIAYDVGFNSKSAFNASFKKHSGVTPSHFRKSI